MKAGFFAHLAFNADSHEEIDQLHPLIQEADAELVDPPKFYPRHGEKYYGLFYKDIDSIMYQIIFEDRN